MQRAKKETQTLYLFVDESGNFDFSPKGSKFFVLSCLSTFQPVNGRDGLLALRYKLLENGTNQEFFHATEDSQEVRNQVFDFIKLLTDDAEIHSVIAQKNKTNPSLYLEEYFKKGKFIRRVIGADFYTKVCDTLLGYVFKRSDFQKAKKIIIVLGALFTRDKQEFVLKTLKKSLKQFFNHKPFEIYFHQSKADLNCQLADYCGWAIAIKWERDEMRPFKLVESKIKSQVEIFAQEKTIYYDFNIKK